MARYLILSEKHVTHRLWQLCQEELNNAAPPQGMFFQASRVAPAQHLGELHIQSSTDHATAPLALSHFPMPLESWYHYLYGPSYFQPLCDFAFPYNLSLERTLGTNSLNVFHNTCAQRNRIHRVSLMRERYGDKICDTKFHLQKSSGCWRAPCKTKPLSATFIIQTWMPPNVTEFKRLTSQIRRFSCHIDARWANLCLSESLNFPLAFQSMSRAIVIINNCVTALCSESW